MSNEYLPLKINFNDDNIKTSNYDNSMVTREKKRICHRDLELNYYSITPNFIEQNGNSNINTQTQFKPKDSRCYNTLVEQRYSKYLNHFQPSVKFFPNFMADPSRNKSNFQTPKDCSIFYFGKK